MICQGDIARYREQANDTANYGKARRYCCLLFVIPLPCVALIQALLRAVGHLSCLLYICPTGDPIGLVLYHSKVTA